MSSYSHYFLSFGLIFPSISLLTILLSLSDRLFFKRRSSPVLIPVIGPVLLDVWLLLVGKPLWTLTLPWILDPATLVFAAISPRLLREWWRTCRFTRQCLLVGQHDIQKATLSFHVTGIYLLQKHWQRLPGELGIVGLGELGRFRLSGSDIELRADNGWSRLLKPCGEDAYSVEEHDGPPEKNSLSGWVLRRKLETPGDGKRF